MCSFGCDHEDIRFEFVKQDTGEIFTHNDLTKLHGWLREWFDRDLFSMTEVAGVMIACMKKSADEHKVGAESVRPLHVTIYDAPNEWGDSFWVRTEYDMMGHLADYGYDGTRAVCYAD
jgi:hypothetical protein